MKDKIQLFVLGIRSVDDKYRRFDLSRSWLKSKTPNLAALAKKLQPHHGTVSNLLVKIGKIELS
jgi:hypothetical protein